MTEPRNGPSLDPTATDALLGHLAPATRAWFKSVSRMYALEPHHSRILLLAAQAWDRGCEGRQRLHAEGLTVPTQQGLKQHPCVRIEHESREQFARLVK